MKKTILTFLKSGLMFAFYPKQKNENPNLIGNPDSIFKK
ncbi:hypothetical protein LEP1GSC052_3272 [Leptospira kmetyi serovar Malaysia str. Bejo-Iso9]|nr:hypothetical protein LEP1GSC052_3272 [Leptospira kmetyi serovar Malaysia str. Bejo-Iso9]